MRNLKLATVALALAGFCLASYAELQFLRLPASGEPVTVEFGGRIVAAQGGEPCPVMRIDPIYGIREEVVTTSATNTTYLLTYTNAVGNVATNVTDYDIAPLPAGYAYISYWTNTVITTTSTTNTTTVVDHTLTNQVCNISTEVVSGLYAAVLTEEEIGYLQPLYLPPGTQLYISGADPAGNADTVVLER